MVTSSTMASRSVAVSSLISSSESRSRVHSTESRASALKYWMLTLPATAQSWLPPTVRASSSRTVCMHSAGIGAVADDVPHAEHTVRARLLDLLEHGAEGVQVPVDVA